MMIANPILKRLGFSDSDRLVILHMDDIGMCQSSITALEHLWDFGTISSGATMVPCPWFPAVAQICRKNPDIDIGVHATLNSEWEMMRWGPISSRDPDTGLLDKDGYFHQWSPAVQQSAKPEAVAVEIEAQVERALAAGIDVTHVDTHMGTVMFPSFVQPYVQSATRRLLPAMLPRSTAKGFDILDAHGEALASFAPILQALELQGLPMLDGLFAMPLDDPHNHIEVAKKMLNDIPAGVSHFLFHPSADTPELRAICPDWECRVADYEAFTSKDLKNFIANSGIHVIGYRLLREAMRS
jgi:predicted glycoside hydrolase/deacetylase ChbG (UPF0249 family)